MEALSYADADLRRILKSVRTVAMVGAKDDPNTAPYFVMKYLQKKGYRVIPVNPKLSGRTLLGETAYASLSAIPERFDMVDIFRNSQAAAGVVDEAIALEDKGVSVVWMQLRVRNDEAAQRAEDAGLTVIMNRCPKIEYARLHGEIGWQGFNSGVISSRRAR